MNVLTINGGLRVKGNSTIMLNEFSRGVRDAGFEVDLVDVKDLNIQSCRGCLRCNLIKRCSLRGDDWKNLSPALNTWRTSCIEFIATLQEDSIIFSHYIAINVIIGHCQNSDKVISYNPDNCSIHHFENSQNLKIVQLGKQAQTTIN